MLQATPSAAQDSTVKPKKLPQATFSLQPTLKNPIDYSLYGQYKNLGTNNFSYELLKKEALSAITPAGIYPNTQRILDMPEYQKLKNSGALSTYHWDALKMKNLQAAYYIWATTHEDLGVKNFFQAKILEQAGLLIPAISAYHAVIIFFPRAVCYAPDRSYVWYIARAAFANIQRILRDYPSLDWSLIDASIEIANDQDLDLKNDIVKVNPGRFVKTSSLGKKNTQKNLGPPQLIRGRGKIQVAQYKNGDWQLLVNKKPFFVQGVSYLPTKIGIGPKSDAAFSIRWMQEDSNLNGKIDAAYDAWVDSNGNNIQDKEEPSVGDFQLLHNMGCNAIRLYHYPIAKTRYDPAWINKPLLRDLSQRFGIKVILGDFLGAYTIGSGASWEKGTDYTDPQQRKQMKEIIYELVNDLKEEPFILMWLLGNENNMRSDHLGHNATRTNASDQPIAYAQFLNEVAEMIHAIDPDHPVAVGNIETNLLDIYAQHAPALDILGINSYRGADGFNSLWTDAKTLFDRPILITEFGCDVFSKDLQAQDPQGQLIYIENNWRDIAYNQAGRGYAGNAIGGIVFEYLDEWWKDTITGDPENSHQTDAAYFMPFPDNASHEEWYGIVGQGKGNNSPYERQIRSAYHYLKSVWRNLPLSETMH